MFVPLNNFSFELIGFILEIGILVSIMLYYIFSRRNNNNDYINEEYLHKLNVCELNFIMAGLNNEWYNIAKHIRDEKLLKINIQSKD